MQETRRARLRAVILEELSVVVPRDVKDPRIPSLTFTGCELTPDAGLATVFVTILGAMPNADDPESERQHRQRMKEALAGLTSAAGFLRRHLAQVLTIRQVPSLVFKEDRGLENANRVHELLKKIGSESSSS